MTVVVITYTHLTDYKRRSFITKTISGDPQEITNTMKFQDRKFYGLTKETSISKCERILVDKRTDQVKNFFSFSTDTYKHIHFTKD